MDLGNEDYLHILPRLAPRKRAQVESCLERLGYYLVPRAFGGHAVARRKADRPELAADAVKALLASIGVGVV